MAKHSSGGFLGYLKDSDEEIFSGGSGDDIDIKESETTKVLGDLIACHSNRSSPESLSLDNTLDSEWKNDILPLGREQFTGNYGVQRIKAIMEDGQVSLDKIYGYFVPDELIDDMVTHTNNYAHSLKHLQTARFSRMARWKDVSREDIKIFFGVIMYMGLNPKPSIEHYWKFDAIYYNPLMHNINMSYNRFTTILRCWHFTEVQIGVIGEERTRKIDTLINKVVSNFRSLYMPTEIIVVDEAMVKFHDKSVKSAYNQSDCYGLKIHRACAINGYTWSYQISSAMPHQLEGLDKPGSTLVQLTKPLLDEGRIIVADKYYTSVPLAEYLKGRKTDLCGTLNPNKGQLPKEVVNAKLRRGTQIVRQKDNLYTILKWRDKHDVLIITSCHGDSISNMSTKSGDFNKPDAVIDYEEAKKGINISGQLSSFYSPIRKSLTWYKKIAIDLLFHIALINTNCIYNELAGEESKLTVLQVQEHIIRQFLGPAASTTISRDFFQGPSLSLENPTSPSISSTSLNTTGHSLQEIPRNGYRLVRKRCTGCYVKLKNLGELARKAKQVHTECKTCRKAFCLDCYNERHAQLIL